MISYGASATGIGCERPAPAWVRFFGSPVQDRRD